MSLLRRAYPQLGGPSQGTIPTEILRAYYPLGFADEIRQGARRSGLPPYLVAGIIRQESGFDPRATSDVGARGLMQLMPTTAREVATSLGRRYHPDDLYDPGTSILLGSTYFSRLLKMFDGNVELALAAYNGGPNRIRRLWRERRAGSGVDEFFETLALDESRNFVKRILVLADSYRRLYPDEEAVEPVPTAG
jgi:soluble lytic murein transglycosylase